MSAQQQPRRPQALLLQCARRALLCAEYAQVTRMLGNGRLEAFCFDGVNRLCHIRGKLRKRVWIGVGDIVLLGLREFQDQKADIILKYDGDEARSLKAYNELPETVQINAGTEALDGEEFGDDNFDFDEVDEI
jgi:translation initiation factor 1A